MPAPRISLKSVIHQSDSVLPPSFNPLIGKWTSIHKALIAREGINAIPSQKALNFSNIAVLRTFIGAENPRSTLNLSYTVTIVLRYDAGIIVSNTGFKPQNAATVSIYCTINTKIEGFLAYHIHLYAKCNLVLWHSTSYVSDAFWIFFQHLLDTGF